MGNVKQYIFSLMVISLASACVNMLTPDESETSKFVNFLVSAVVCVVLLSPIHSLLKTLPELLSYDIEAYAEVDSDEAVYADSIINAAIDNIKRDISLSLQKKFSIDAEKIEIEYDSSDIENIVINKVVIFIQKGNKYISSDICRYLSSLLSCECEVEYQDEK